MDFKKPSSPILTPQDLMKYLDDPKYCHEDIESSSALKHGVSVCVLLLLKCRQIADTLQNTLIVCNYKDSAYAKGLCGTSLHSMYRLVQYISILV